MERNNRSIHVFTVAEVKRANNLSMYRKIVSINQLFWESILSLQGWSLRVVKHIWFQCLVLVLESD